jgi:multiple sugar transport system substrate-binding protein
MVHALNGNSAATLGGWGLSVSQFSRNKDLAIKYVAFLARADIQKLLILKTGFVPVRHSLYRDQELLQKFPFYGDLYKVELSGVPRPPVPQYAAVSDILQRYVSGAISDRISIDEALAYSDKETRGRLQ